MLIPRFFNVLINSKLMKHPLIPESISRVEEITGKKIPTHQVDLLDKNAIIDIFKKVSTSELVLVKVF